jgi:hypothetical protein
MRELLILTLLFCLALGAQDAPPVPSVTESPTAEEPAVPEEDVGSLPVGRDTPLQIMIRSFDRIRLERTENAARLDSLHRQMQELLQQPTANAFAATAMKMRRGMQELEERLHIERENQIGFKNDIDRYSAERQLLRQEASYLSHFLDELKLYGLEQEKAMKLIQVMRTSVAARLDRLPPPPEFTNRVGMSFVLVNAKGLSPFYVSNQAMTQEQYLAILKLMAPPDRPSEELSAEAERAFRDGLTFSETQRLALGIAHLSGAQVMLPNAKEVAALATVGFGKELERAVWLRDKWNAPYGERDAIIRFGAVMNAVWDPAGRLTRRGNADQAEVIGELPEAHYPGLGCIFVAPVIAGKAARLAQAEEAAMASNPQEEK